MEHSNQNIVKLLQIVKNFVELHEVSGVNLCIGRLKKYVNISEIGRIIELLQNENYSVAIKKIEEYLLSITSVSEWVDPEIFAMKLEIKTLEKHIAKYDSEKKELEKLLNDFQYKHSVILGEIILQILKLRKLKFQGTGNRYEEAQRDEEEYQKQYNSNKRRILKELKEDDRKKLKKQYREAVLLCHPDKFNNESFQIKRQAEETFKHLSKAYAENDLKRVSQILNNLKDGTLITLETVNISAKETLLKTIKNLKMKIDQIKSDIEIIHTSKGYKKLISIKDWDSYFSEMKEKFTKELELLKRTYLNEKE